MRTTVTLTANAQAGATFAGWDGGGCMGTAAVCTLYLLGAARVSTRFVETPSVRVQSVSVVEGNEGSTMMEFPVTLSQPAAVRLTVERRQ